MIASGSSKISRAMGNTKYVEHLLSKTTPAQTTN